MLVDRRKFLGGTAHTAVCALFANHIEVTAKSAAMFSEALDSRFPFFKSVPVSYLDVKMTDKFWAPRQKTIREVTVPWATQHWDGSGGLAEFKKHPQDYRAQLGSGDFEAVKFIEAMASVVGLQRDASIEGLTERWIDQFLATQGSDGYLRFAYPHGSDPEKRWRALWWTHEDYVLGHYLEGALAYREATGRTAMYDSAVRAIDNMVQAMLGGNRAYTSNHQGIEQALMRLYGTTGDSKYLQLCGWLIDQRGRHEGRPSFGKYAQDHLPVKRQRTIEGHAVRAAFLFNGVTEYVGATGDEGYREAVLAIWEDFVNHKMYLHGAGGLGSLGNEGYSSRPDFIPPNDCYGESCSVFGNFQWAHNLFRLTGDAAYIDVAERMLYNAFYASLALHGDRYFYTNTMQKEEPALRLAWHPVPCCPPNIVKLFARIGGFFYSTDVDGVFIKHYGASQVRLAFGRGVTLVQRADYPWSGNIAIDVQPVEPVEFTLRLRIPAWAKSYSLAVNRKSVSVDTRQGWLVVRRRWRAGDEVRLQLPMDIERVTMPPRFNEYANLTAVQRGPVVYCLEEQDAPVPVRTLILSEDARLTAEHAPDLFGGVTVIRAQLQHHNIFSTDAPSNIATTLIPYGLWNNRGPSTMRVWLKTRPAQLNAVSAVPPGEQS